MLSDRKLRAVPEILVIGLALVLTSAYEYNGLYYQLPSMHNRQILDDNHEENINIDPVTRSFSELIQSGVEELLEFGSNLRLKILEILGTLVYDHYDEFSIDQLEELYKVYHDNLRRAYNVFEIAPKLYWLEIKTKNQNICRAILENVCSYITDSSKICMNFENSSNYSSVVKKVSQNAKHTKDTYFSNGLTLPAILEALTNNELKITAKLISGLLQNIPYDSLTPEVQISEKTIINFLDITLNFKFYFNHHTINNYKTMDEFLKDLLIKSVPFFPAYVRNDVLYLSKHIQRDINSISENIENFGTTFENKTINLKYLFELVIPNDLVDVDIIQARDFLRFIMERNIPIELIKNKYEHETPDQLLQEILMLTEKNSELIRCPQNIVKALLIHTKFWRKIHIISNINSEFPKLFDAYNNLLNTQGFKSFFDLANSIIKKVQTFNKVDIKLTCSMPRPCLRRVLLKLSNCSIIDKETKTLFSTFLEQIDQNGRPLLIKNLYDTKQNLYKINNQTATMLEVGIHNVFNISENSKENTTRDFLTEKSTTTTEKIMNYSKIPSQTENPISFNTLTTIGPRKFSEVEFNKNKSITINSLYTNRSNTIPIPSEKHSVASNIAVLLPSGKSSTKLPSPDSINSKETSKESTIHEELNSALTTTTSNNVVAESTTNVAIEPTETSGIFGKTIKTKIFKEITSEPPTKVISEEDTTIYPVKVNKTNISIIDKKNTIKPNINETTVIKRIKTESSNNCEDNVNCVTESCEDCSKNNVLNHSTTNSNNECSSLGCEETSEESCESCSVTSESVECQLNSTEQCSTETTSVPPLFDIHIYKENCIDGDCSISKNCSNEFCSSEKICSSEDCTKSNETCKESNCEENTSASLNLQSIDSILNITDSVCSGNDCSSDFTNEISTKASPEKKVCHGLGCLQPEHTSRREMTEQSNTTNVDNVEPKTNVLCNIIDPHLENQAKRLQNVRKMTRLRALEGKDKLPLKKFLKRVYPGNGHSDFLTSTTEINIINEPDNKTDQSFKTYRRSGTPNKPNDLSNKKDRKITGKKLYVDLRAFNLDNQSRALENKLMFPNLPKKLYVPPTKQSPILRFFEDLNKLQLKKSRSTKGKFKNHSQPEDTQRGFNSEEKF